MRSGFFGSGRRWRGAFALIACLSAGLACEARAGLTESERITLNQPACAQMKSYSQDITLLNDEMQNVRRFGQRGRMCDVLNRATNTVDDTIGYMRQHVGECTITPASIDQMTTLSRDLVTDKRKLCR